MKKYRLTHTSGTKHKIKNAFILFIPYHQALFILFFIHKSVILKPHS